MIQRWAFNTFAPHPFTVADKGKWMLATDVAALEDRNEKLEEVVACARDLQLVYRSAIGVECCAECHQPTATGHRGNCVTGMFKRALADLEKPNDD